MAAPPRRTRAPLSDRISDLVALGLCLAVIIGAAVSHIRVR